MKTIIVGKGLAGTWLARELHGRGHDVTVIHHEEPGSSAAIALLRSTYLAPEERSLLAPALARWNHLDQEILTGARATRKGSPKDLHEADWYAVHPELPRLEPDIRVLQAHAKPLSETMVWTPKGEVEGDMVVWCDAGGAGHRTYGCTWVHDDPGALVDSFRVHQWAPYRVIAGARYSDHARMGSSSAGSLLKAIDQASRVFAEAQEAGMLTTERGWKRLDGTRLQRPLSLTKNEFGWRWSGFHKNGYALVPALVGSVADVMRDEL